MQDNIINSFAEQAKTVFAPMNKFSELFVSNLEKMTEFQLNSVKSYAEIGLSQLKSAADIKDAESLRSFSAAQAEWASTVNKKMIEDAKTLTDIGLEFKQQMEGLWEEARNTAAAQAKKK